MDPRYFRISGVRMVLWFVAVHFFIISLGSDFGGKTMSSNSIRCGKLFKLDFKQSEVCNLITDSTLVRVGSTIAT